MCVRGREGVGRRGIGEGDGLGDEVVVAGEGGGHFVVGKGGGWVGGAGPLGGEGRYRAPDGRFRGDCLGVASALIFVEGQEGLGDAWDMVMWMRVLGVISRTD